MNIKIRKFFLHQPLFAIILTTFVVIILVAVIVLSASFIPKAPSTDYTSALCAENVFIRQIPMVGVANADTGVVPKDTMAALKTNFENNNAYSLDILYFTLRLTADNQLIVLTDATLDVSSDCITPKFGEKNVRPIQKTVGELKQYNMGYHFKNADGVYIYRSDRVNLDYCRVITLNEALEYLRTQEQLWKKSFLYGFTLADKGQSGQKSAEILANALTAYGLTSRATVQTLDEPTKQTIQEILPTVNRSADRTETASFYFSFLFGVDLSSKKLFYNVLTLPSYFAQKTLVDYAHKYGIAVHFTGINSLSLMKKCKKIGADAIISIDPTSCYDIVKS